LVVFYDLKKAQLVYSDLQAQKIQVSFVELQVIIPIVKSDMAVYALVVENQGSIRISNLPSNWTLQNVSQLLDPFGSVKAIHQLENTWIIEFFDLRDCSLAVRKVNFRNNV
jgi:hypothetical protein